MTPLAMTALVQEGPMARSYLGLLQASGYRFERVVLMVQRRDPATRRRVAPWLPVALRRPLARTLQDLRMNHWPREFLRRHGQWCRPWLHELALAYSVDPAVFQTLVERPAYARYAAQVDEVLTDGLGDPALARHLSGLPGRTTLLFTGGGMVPASLLNLPQCRFIHVHPGVLPNVRGADGLLWSMLLRARPGATAFYLNAGLDMGDIILADDLDIPPLPMQFSALDAAMRYRLLYAFVDPMLRALVLRRVIEQTPGDLFDLPSQGQCASSGSTFHFMNERLRALAFDRMQTLCATSRSESVVAA